MHRRDFLKTAAAVVAVGPVLTPTTTEVKPLAVGSNTEGNLPLELYAYLHPMVFLAEVLKEARKDPSSWAHGQFSNGLLLAGGSMPARTLIDMFDGEDNPVGEFAKHLGIPECLREPDVRKIPKTVQLHHITRGQNIHKSHQPGDMQIYWIAGDPFAALYYRLPDGTRFSCHYGERLLGQPDGSVMGPAAWSDQTRVTITGPLVMAAFRAQHERRVAASTKLVANQLEIFHGKRHQANRT